jgi:cysteine-rich repeat protein
VKLRSSLLRASFVLSLAPFIGAAYVGCGGGNSNSASGDDGGGSSSGSSGGSSGGSGSSSGGSSGGHDATTGGPYCGDGVVNNGEQCDFGAGKNLPGSGCETDCKFSCTTSPNSCMTTNPCAGTASCGSVTGPNGGMGQKCTNGMAPPDGTSCGANGLVCKSGQCTSANCGNGTIDTGEQCDDGNVHDLDGCDSRCNYEMVLRLNSLAISRTAAPSYCMPTTNTLGTKTLTTFSVPILNNSVSGDIDAGTLNVMTQLLGLTDLTGGTSESSGLSFGILNGSLDPAKGTWPNQSPIDWWFLADRTTVSDGLPTSMVSSTLSNRSLNAGPADVTIVLSLGGQPSPLEVRSAYVVATLDGTPAPNVPGPPPAKLANGLTVLQTMTASAANQGLCGNITVESLANVPIPAMLSSPASAGAAATHPCTAACPMSNVYTYCGMGMPVGPNCNSLLDVLVGGCNVATSAALCGLSALTEVVNPTQPDVPASGGSSTMLTPDATTHKIPATQTSGDKDAYSAFMTFTGNRAHFTSQTCTATTDCQQGLTCQSGVCK